MSDERPPRSDHDPSARNRDLSGFVTEAVGVNDGDPSAGGPDQPAICTTSARSRLRRGSCGVAPRVVPVPTAGACVRRLLVVASRVSDICGRAWGTRRCDLGRSAGGEAPRPPRADLGRSGTAEGTSTATVLVVRRVEGVARRTPHAAEPGPIRRRCAQEPARRWEVVKVSTRDRLLGTAAHELHTSWATEPVREIPDGRGNATARSDCGQGVIAEAEAGARCPGVRRGRGGWRQ